MFCYHLFKVLKEKHNLPGFEWPLLIQTPISASQRGPGSHRLSGKLERGWYLIQSLWNGVLTSLESELQN